jgi:hypothetical protein
MLFAGAEYHFPIIYLDRGIGTLPLYIQKIYGIAFADFGHAWDGKIDFGDFNLGVGGELRADIIAFYNFPVQFRIGYGRSVLNNIDLDDIFWGFTVNF